MTLSVASVVNVSVDLSNRAAGTRDFGVPLILTTSPYIDMREGMRRYTSAEDVATDAGADSPEAKAAAVYFGQSPRPVQMWVGRWAKTNTNGTLVGGSVATTIADFTAINSGGFNVTIDGVVRSVSALDFTADTNLNAVAARVQTALAAYATLTWDSRLKRFTLKALSSGATSGVSFATPPGSGVDISALLGLNANSGGYSVAGVNAESAADCVARFLDRSNDWYGLDFVVDLTDAERLAVAGLIEASSVSRIWGVDANELKTLDPVDTTGIAYLMKNGRFRRTFTVYTDRDATGASIQGVDAIFGKMFPTKFTGQNTTQTLKFKTLAGVPVSDITASQESAAKAKNCNIFVLFDNGDAIVEEGVMCDGTYFDEVHGLDWLQNLIQTNCWNVLKTSAKVPQTDPGVTQLIGAVANACGQARTNGLVAPGVWNGPALGPINTGATLTEGYFIFAQPIAFQPQADREARKAPLIQVALKLAGAFHSADVLVTVNR